jgi:F-type H+-transporting ATPase subunit delta
MEASTLARPYARAAFEAAGDEHALDAWSSNLAVAAGLAADPRLAGLGNDPRIGPEQLAELYRPADVAAGSPFARFLAVLADNRRLSLLPDIARLFDAMRREAEHRVRARLRCATQPTPEQEARLGEALKRRYDSNIDLEIDVDPTMIGGAVLDVGGEVIDGSIRARLHQLQTALMR